MLKSDLFINAFNKMGQEDLVEEDNDVLESFTCSIFGYSKLASINEARDLQIKISANQKKQKSHQTA